MIRSVRLPAATSLAEGGIQTSCLGFGCASLGSRVSAKAGLSALARAHDAGLRWLDVAPAYGAGEAETILSHHLAGRRDGVAILTKVGLAPPRRSGLMRAAYAAARPFLGAARGLRAGARRLSATRNVALAITPELIERSIAQSLRRLRADHVEVYALHDPSPATVTDEAVLRALERVAARGQARFLGVAGDREACLAAIGPGLPYAFVQTAVGPDGRGIADIRARAARPVTIIGHSVFGLGAARADLAARLRRDVAARDLLRSAGYDADDIEAGIAALLLDAALAENADGVTLVSMFQPAHLAANLARAGAPPNPHAASVLRQLASERAMAEVS